MPAARRASLSHGRENDDDEIRTARTGAGAARTGQDRSDSARAADARRPGRHADTDAASGRPAGARGVSRQILDGSTAERQPRRAALIAATSIFFMSIIASN